MLLNCPNPACKTDFRSRTVRHGSFFRSSDSRWISRFRCQGCHRSFSHATLHPCFGQKKRRVNEPLRKLLCSGISMRRAALFLHVHRRTVARKLVFLASQARISQEQFVKELDPSALTTLQFDEMETFEHSKCKPLSLPLVVTHPGRKILGFSVCSMPAKGLLAQKARRKYGYRPDHRRRTLHELFKNLVPRLSPTVRWVSDENPHYPAIVKKHFPYASHETIQGQRGAVTGQGELKKIKWDPLFSLNHTAAMLRANINRLFRRTWCTTKRADRLYDHVSLYVDFHNRELTKN